MYRVILVDDEEEIREGIKRRIDWAACGFQLVSTAENGQEAMEKAEALHPDVVITDIKMPYVDGLTLCRWLYERMPGVKLVIFSGFDDFEYAQKAIQIGVTEYILKPVSADELTAVLHKLRTQLDTEFAQRRDINALRQHYVQSLPMLREQFLTRLMDGRITQEKLNSQAALYDIDLTAGCWAVALAHVDAPQSGVLADQSELIPLSVKVLIDENLGRFCTFRSFIYNDHVAVIALLEENSQVLSLLDGMDHVCKMAGRFLDISLTVGIGSVCEQLTDLHHSATGAATALDYRLLMGTGKTIFLDDIEPEQGIQLTIDEQDKRELTLAIKMGTTEDIQSWIERFVVSPQVAGLPIAQYRLYLLELMAQLLSIIRAYQLDVTEVFGQNFDGSLGLSSFRSTAQLGSWFLEICKSISSMIRRERSNSSQTIADCAREFIAKQYADPDVSVEMLCDYLHLSPAYFSTLFKRETGMSFVAYLTQVRMEEAVKLLDTTQDKTYEISLKVGYSEPSYFSYVFKKNFGVSPSKYRSSKDGLDG